MYLCCIKVHTWSIDANQFVADEDESTYSCRVSGMCSISHAKLMLFAETLHGYHIINRWFACVCVDVVNNCSIVVYLQILTVVWYC